MTELWYYRLLGREFGPVSEAVLHALIADGTIGASAEVRRSRDSQWQRADQLDLAAASIAAGDEATPDLDSLLAAPASHPSAESGRSGEVDDDDLNSMLSSEAPRRRRVQANEWSYRINGQRFGPFDFDTLFEHAAAGRFSRYDEIRAPGSDEWVEAQTIVGLFADEEVDLDTMLVDEPPLPASAAPKPAPVKKQWHYRVLNQVLGPVDFEGLFDLVMEGNLRPDDDVRESGQTEWQRADSLVGLFPDDIYEVSAPEVTAATAAATQTNDAAEDADWYFKMDDQELGPVTFERLMQLAQGGRLQKTDPIRLTRLGSWMEAGSMVGLFPEEAPPEPAPTIGKKGSTKAKDSSVPERPTGDADDWAAAVLAEDEPEPPPRRHSPLPRSAEPAESRPAAAVAPPDPAPAAAAALSIATKMAASASAQRATFTPPPKSSRKSSSGGGFSLPSGLGDTLANPKLLGALGAVALGVALFFVPWGSLFGPGAEDLTTELEGIWGQVKPLHENDAPDAEWARVSGTVAPKLSEIAKEATDRGAGPHEPALQIVLVLASQSIPKVLKEKSQTKDNQLKIVDNFFARLKELE
jgi:hypothetical protein